MAIGTTNSGVNYRAPRNAVELWLEANEVTFHEAAVSHRLAKAEFDIDGCLENGRECEFCGEEIGAMETYEPGAFRETEFLVSWNVVRVNNLDRLTCCDDCAEIWEGLK